jgi:hypothetical protein
METLKKYLGKRKLPEIKNLKKLGTRNLLSFYKAERKRYYNFIGSITCGCCGERTYNLYPKKCNDDKVIEDEWSSYLNSVKLLLNKRENI